MDTPLYVLSTAASMVESVDLASYHFEGTTVERTYNADRNSPAPESALTARAMLPPYQDLARQAQVADKTTPEDDTTQNSKKCAGTQTPFSTFNSVPYGSEQFNKMNPRTKTTYRSDSPPSYYSHHSTITSKSYPYSYQEDMETDDDKPLNLTKSSATHQSNNITSSTSPSPLSRPSPPSSRSSSNTSPLIRNTHSTENSQNTCNSSRYTVSNDLDDPEIEEHFRRSLGTKYSSYLSSRGSPRNGETADGSTSKSTNVSITGDVDDHFAKSLGDTWTKLNAKKPVAILTGTVDDHFAKALGDTWYKIQANAQS